MLVSGDVGRCLVRDRHEMVLSEVVFLKGDSCCSELGFQFLCVAMRVSLHYSGVVFCGSFSLVLILIGSSLRFSEFWCLTVMVKNFVFGGMFSGGISKVSSVHTLFSMVECF